jgi:hypothetical protein
LPTLFEHEGLARLVVANHAPQPLTVTLDGPAEQTIELSPCDGCEITPFPPTTCSPDAPRTTIDIPPGAYLVTSTRPAGDAPPLAGPWTFVPNAAYGACFFIVDTG